MIVEGHKALDTDLEAALHYFGVASMVASSPVENAEAKQMLGVAFRKKGKLATAVRYGQAALDFATESGVLSLMSGAARDLAASQHILGISNAKKRKASFTAARRNYELASDYDWASRTSPTGDAEESGAQYYVNLGMAAALRYDAAHYRIELYDDDNKFGRMPYGDTQLLLGESSDWIADADAGLQRFSNRIWEFNNLIKRIQMVSVEDKPALIRRALKLVEDFPERKNEIWLSMMGRGVFRLTIILRGWRRRLCEKFL